MSLIFKLGKVWRRRQHYYYTYCKRDLVAIRRLFAVKRWFADRGDETRRLDYPLNAESMVFDLGAYKGDFAAAIYEKFNCYVYLFEPISSFYKECVERFKDNPKISCFNFGLSSRDGAFLISLEENASSIVKTTESGNGEQVIVRKFSSFCEELRVKQIDLIKNQY
jgi:FkbM family methyltransferase